MTASEVYELKQAWLNDPCWDIEKTEGFELYHDELLEWSNQVHAINVWGCQLSLVEYLIQTEARLKKLEKKS